MNQLFSTILTGNQTLDRIQQNISNAFNQLFVPSLFFGGNFLQNITLTAGQNNTVNHGLGRTPRIWILCDLTGTTEPTLAMNSYTPAGTISGSTFTGTPATLTGTVTAPVVWRVSWNSASLVLACGADCTVGLWVN